jgi:carbon starvation protein
MPTFAVTLYHLENGKLVMHAMPVLLFALCILAIAYRFYSKFLATKVAVLDANHITPAVRLNDGSNYHPTNKWVAFGHHFAAISGAGPLIGPVLAIQYGWAPGLFWLVVGVCLAGAVQDMLVMAASVRRDGKSLAEIARAELGRPAAAVASAAILFIIIIALAGLGIIVVKALGGEEVKLPKGTLVIVPYELVESVRSVKSEGGAANFNTYPVGTRVRYPGQEDKQVTAPLVLRTPVFVADSEAQPNQGYAAETLNRELRITLPAGCVELVPGSSWGTFTIAATIPIALLVGLWMYRIRPGRVIEASLMGAALTLFAVVAGGWIPGSSLEPYFSLTKNGTILALVIYGFVAAVLPVWLLLGPRDYLSSFLKIGTIALLVGSVFIANPPLNAPALNEVFINGGPTFKGNIFPFVFICVMCGAVSGFHALVSSGTTPKMIENESQIRGIGYGAMLMECVVGMTALISAAALPNHIYYDINVPLDQAQTAEMQGKLKDVYDRYGRDPMHNTATSNLAHIGQVEEKVGGESLRGRTGGAPTLAVGMSFIFVDAFHWIGIQGDWLLKYWYHFAIMFEALFILTTIDAGTRIGRFLLQETLGRIYSPFANPKWLPGSLIASAAICSAWGWLIYSGSVDTIWPMFGIANQLLAALALSIVTTWLVNQGRGRFVWVTVAPMLFVMTTTLTAATNLITQRFPKMIADGEAMVKGGETAAGNKMILTGTLNIALILFVTCTVLAVILMALARWITVFKINKLPESGGTASR